MNQAATDLEGFSRWLTKLFRAGVVTGWTVTQRAAGANMSVDIAPGDGVPMTTDTAPWDWSTAVKNVSIGAASANNRRDLVVAYTDLSVTNPSTSWSRGLRRPRRATRTTPPSGRRPLEPQTLISSWPGSV